MKIERDWIYVDLPKEKAADMGAVWNDKRSTYRLPNTLGVLRELYKLSDAKDQFELAAYGMRKATRLDTLLSLKRLEDTEGDPRLRTYQRVDVNYLKQLRHAGIFNEQRTGKTPTSLVLCQELDYKKIIIVCPAGLVLQWGEEVEKWTNLKPLCIKGAKKKRLDYYEEWLHSRHVLIVSYETLRNDLHELMKTLKKSKIKVDSLIVDEAHRLRNRKTKQTKAVNVLGNQVQHRYALTGTPTVKHGTEIWGILHFLYPDRFPGYWQFVDRYFNVIDGRYGKEIGTYKRKEELEDILATISTNRKRKEVMKWLPPKQYQTITLDMLPKQAKVYQDVLETFEYEDKIDAISPMVQLMRLRQITTAPSMLDVDVPGAKEQFVLEWLEDNPNESVIIFSNYTSYLEKLHAKVKGSVMITGKISKAQRKKNEAAFQSGKAKVLLANIKAAQEGLTLDKGETVIFLDKEYNPANNQQAEDRIIPISKDRNHSCLIITLVCNDTYDEIIEFMLKHKYDITKVVNNGGITALERLWKEV